MLHGDSVILRPMERADIPRLWEFGQDLEIGLAVGAGGRPVPLAVVETLYEEMWADPSPDSVRFGIEAHGGMLIGGAEITDINWQNRTARLAVWIGDRTFRRRGCGSDATRVALNYCFKLLGLHRVEMQLPESNEAGLACYKSVGFEEEGRLRKALYKDGEYEDLIHMAVLREDWSDESPLQAVQE